MLEFILGYFNSQKASEIAKNLNYFGNSFTSIDYTNTTDDRHLFGKAIEKEYSNTYDFYSYTYFNP